MISLITLYTFFIGNIQCAPGPILKISKKLEEVVIKKIDTGDYYKHDMSKKVPVHTFSVRTSFIKMVKEDKEKLCKNKVSLFLKNDILAKLIYELYIKEDKSPEKMLAIKAENRIVYENMKAFLMDIPEDIIKRMKTKYGIKEEEYCEEYLDYKGVYPYNSCLYKHLTNSDTRQQTNISNDAFSFYLNLSDNVWVFFNIPFESEEFSLKNSFLEENFTDGEGGLNYLKTVYPHLDLEHILFAIDHDLHYDYKYIVDNLEKFNPINLRHKKLQSEEMNSAFFVLQDLQRYVFDPLKGNEDSEHLYVYYNEKYLGINDFAYKCLDGIDGMTTLSEKTLIALKKNFEALGISPTSFYKFPPLIRQLSRFLGYKITPLLKMVLQKWRRVQSRADIITLLHLALYTQLIDKNELLQLTNYKTSEIYDDLIYSHLVDIIIAKLCSKPVEEICSVRFYYFHKFIDMRIKEMYEKEKKLKESNDQHVIFNSKELELAFENIKLFETAGENISHAYQLDKNMLLFILHVLFDIPVDSNLEVFVENHENVCLIIRETLESESKEALRLFKEKLGLDDNDLNGSLLRN